MSLNKNNILIFFCCVCTGLLPAQTTQDSILTEQLDGVVVTATRTLRQLSSLPLPVTLIPKTQIEQSGLTRLNEILNEQTGIVMTPDATIGSGEGVQIQGIASDYILILIDGVPMVGRSAGNLDLSRFAVGSIKQIEVVKGPSSSLFGSEALGGVINIITETPASEKVSGRLSHRTASFNNQNTTLNLSQRLGKLGISLFADRLSTAGYDLALEQEAQTVNPFFNYTFNGRLSYDFSDRWDVFLSARHFYQEFDMMPSTSEETDTNLQLRLNQDSGARTNFQYEFYYTRYTTDEQVIDPIDNALLVANDFDQRLFRPEFRFNYRLTPGNTFSAGSGYNFEWLDRSLFQQEVRFDSQYVFLQYDFKPFQNTNLIAGLRFDHHSEYNAQLSPKFSALYQFSPALSLKASVGSGFKAPDFRQLYLDFTNAAGGGYSVFGKAVEAEGIGRLQESGEISSLQVEASSLGEPLKAESSVGYNLGLGLRIQKFSLDLNFFRNDFQNLIDTRILAAKSNGQNVFGYINRESVFTQGMEVDLSWEPINYWKFQAGYQLLYAYDKSDRAAAAQGEVFARDPLSQQTIRLGSSDYFGLENRSRHTLNLKAFYEIPKWDTQANLRVVYRSRFGLADRNGNGLLDRLDDAFVKGYALVNMALTKTLLKKYQIQLGANNLLNFRGNNPLAAQDSEVLLNPGRQLFAKINFQF